MALDSTHTGHGSTGAARDAVHARHAHKGHHAPGHCEAEAPSEAVRECRDDTCRDRSDLKRELERQTKHGTSGEQLGGLGASICTCLVSVWHCFASVWNSCGFCWQPSRSACLACKNIVHETDMPTHDELASEHTQTHTPEQNKGAHTRMATPQGHPAHTRQQGAGKPAQQIVHHHAHAARHRPQLLRDAAQRDACGRGGGDAGGTIHNHQPASGAESSAVEGRHRTQAPFCTTWVSIREVGLINLRPKSAEGT